MTRDRRHDEHTAPRHNRQPRREPAIDGPTPSDIGEAFHALLETPVEQTPDLSAVRTLKDAGIGFPVTVGDRRIIGVSIERGQTGIGAGHLRSDDHISYYEVEYDEACPQDGCHSEVTRYKYSANHHIACRESTFCPRCDTVHESEEWH